MQSGDGNLDLSFHLIYLPFFSPLFFFIFFFFFLLFLSFPKRNQYDSRQKNNDWIMTRRADKPKLNF